MTHLSSDVWLVYKVNAITLIYNIHIRLNSRCLCGSKRYEKCIVAQFYGHTYEYIALICYFVHASALHFVSDVFCKVHVVLV